MVLAAAFALTGCGLAAACSGGAASGAPDAGGSEDGGPGPVGDAELDAGLDADFDAAACPPPSSAIPAGMSAARGTLEGPAVGAMICSVRANIYVSPYTTPRGRILLMLDSDQSATTARFQSPSGANDLLLTGMLSMPAAAPGVYTSSDAESCGGLALEYALPLPPGVDCDGGTPPACPPNCSAACSGQGCGPCTPTPPTVAYEAKAPSDCLGSSQTVTGSWTLVLTSATPYTPDGGAAAGTYYTPHGEFVGQLSSEDGGTTPTTLALKF